jgi:hypothetical protein
MQASTRRLAHLKTWKNHEEAHSKLAFWTTTVKWLAWANREARDMTGREEHEVFTIKVGK